MSRTYRKVADLPWPGLSLGRDAHTNHYGEDWETLHVMSAHAGGQVRGYHRLVGEATWRVWLPAHEGHWPEMDRAVADATGETVQGLEGGHVDPSPLAVIVARARAGTPQ